MHRQILTAAAAGTLMVSATAAAELQGIVFELVGTNMVDPSIAGGDNYTVDVWAHLDDGNRLDAVAGNSTITKLINTSGTFYQQPFGGATSANNNDALWVSFPELEYDSFVTINCLSSQCGGANNAMQAVGIDFSDFEANGRFW